MNENNTYSQDLKSCLDGLHADVEESKRQDPEKVSIWCVYEVSQLFQKTMNESYGYVSLEMCITAKSQFSIMLYREHAGSKQL